MDIKIVSWNVNGIRAAYKKTLPNFLKEVRPDVFCIQETKAHLNQIEMEVQTLGYNESHWSSAERKGYSGVATFSNTQIQGVEKGIDRPTYDNEGRFVISHHKVSSPSSSSASSSSSFSLYNIYFPNGGSGAERHHFKQNFLKELKAHIENQLKKGEPLIILGDFNIAHTPADIYDPIGLENVSGFLPEERQWLDAFLDLGLIDTYRYLHPNAKEKYTWWSYRTFAKRNNRGWRIDYILISKNLLAHLKSADIHTDTESSDHCPIEIVLNFPE